MFHPGLWPYTFYAYPDVSLVVITVWGHGRAWPGAGAKPGRRCYSCHSRRAGPCRGRLASSTAASGGTHRCRSTSYSPRESILTLASHHPHYAARQGMTLKQPSHVITPTTNHTRGSLNSHSMWDWCKERQALKVDPKNVIAFTHPNCLPRASHTWDVIQRIQNIE